VVAAAVIRPHPLTAPWSEQVADSKLVCPARRERLYLDIKGSAVAVGVGIIPAGVIDARDIVTATRLAMAEAIAQLRPAPDWLLIDHLRLPEVPLPQQGITNGDRLCFAIACASIIAKVARDRLMRELDGVYPGYGLARHKGYGTREHLLNLRQRGPCPIHRRTFAPVREALGR
jgi:ribonuclease HII